MIGYIVSVLLSVISGILVFVVQNLIRENDRLRHVRQEEDRIRQEAISGGVLSLLKIQLFEYYEKYMADGNIPSYVYQNWEEMFTAYTALGGNGTIKKMNDDIERLRLDNKGGSHEAG